MREISSGELFFEDPPSSSIAKTKPVSDRIPIGRRACSSSVPAVLDRV
jgi:hypothetical protein